MHENVEYDRYRGVGLIDPRLSVATLVRLLLPDLFAGHYDSLLYLDCDLTIHTDVSQLFRLDIGACPVAAQRRGMLFLTPLLAEEGVVHTGTSTARGPDRYHERASARSSVRISLPPHARIIMAAPLGPPPPPLPPPPPPPAKT